jgi:hypothetical protein
MNTLPKRLLSALHTMLWPDNIFPLHPTPAHGWLLAEPATVFALRAEGATRVLAAADRRRVGL